MIFSQQRFYDLFSPILVGITLAIIVSILWVLGGLQIGVEDELRFFIILILQFIFHFLIGFYTTKFAIIYGYANPNYILWLIYSLSHLQLYGISNLFPVCIPSKLHWIETGYLVVPETLPEANLFVIFAYFLTAIFFKEIIKNQIFSFNSFDIKTIFKQETMFYMALFSTIVLVGASIRIGPLYNSAFGQEVLDDSGVLGAVSPVEKFFYAGMFAFPATAPVTLALYTLFSLKSNRIKFSNLFCTVSSILAVLAFSIFRMRTWAILSAVSALVPYLNSKRTRFIAFVFAIPTIAITYTIVTSLRFGAISNLGSGFDIFSYFDSAQTDMELIGNSALIDISYSRAGLNPISVIIDFQQSGQANSRWGFQFLCEFLAGFPNFVRDIFPQELRMTTESLLGQSINRDIDIAEVSYLAFVHDLLWPVACLIAPIGFYVILIINTLVIKILIKLPQAGFIYVPWLASVLFATRYATYSNIIKTMFPWFIVSILINELVRKTKKYKKQTNRNINL